MMTYVKISYMYGCKIIEPYWTKVIYTNNQLCYNSLLIWLYGSLHWADNQLPRVAITVAALLNKRELEGRGLVVHKVHCLLGFRL